MTGPRVTSPRRQQPDGAEHGRRNRGQLPEFASRPRRSPRRSSGAQAEAERAADQLAIQPIATSTGEGSLDPLAQAEPVEQATPARSSAITSACRSSLRNATFDVCGSRGAAAPLTTAGSKPASSADSSRSRRAAIRAARAGPSAANISRPGADRRRERPARFPAANPTAENRRRVGRERRVARDHERPMPTGP